MSKLSNALYLQGFQYDFTKNGGALGDINTGIGCINTGITLPENSLVIQFTIMSIIAPVSALNAAVFDIGEIGNTFRTGISTNPFVSGNYLGTGAGFISGTLGLPVQLAIRTQVLTAGKFNCFLLYIGPFTLI